MFRLQFLDRNYAPTFYKDPVVRFTNVRTNVFRSTNSLSLC